MSKKIVITGGTSGVGKMSVDFFIKKGYIVYALGRNSSKLNDLENEYNSDNLKCIEVDIKDYISVKKAFDKIDKIDYLINNASIFKSLPLSKLNDSDISNIIDTNLKGTIYCTMEAMKKMYSGRIINIGSVSGTHGIENQTAYSASKFGLMGFSESLAQELDNILITTICPGGINTPLWNDENKYPGDVDDLLDTMDIVNTIDYIIGLPSNVIVKDVKLFPKCEWH